MSRTIALTWTANTYADGYEIDVFRGGTYLTVIENLTSSVESYNYDAEPGYEYTFKIWSIKEAAREGPCSVRTVLVPDESIGPPENFQATLV